MSLQVLAVSATRILMRLIPIAVVGVTLAAICSEGVRASPCPARAKIIPRQESISFIYVGESGPAGFGDDVGPIGGKQRPKFRNVSYSGDFVWQRFHGYGWTTTAYTISGAKAYSPATGAIISQAMVQPCNIIGMGSTVAVGSPSGSPVTLPYAEQWGMFKLSNYATQTGGVRQGDNVLHEVPYPSVPSTEWTRDNVTITYSDPDTMDDAIKRGSKTSGGGYTSGYSSNSVTRCFYQIQFEAGCGTYIFHFKKKKTPCAGGDSDYFKDSIVADITNGGMSPEFELPLEDGFVWEILPEIWAEPAGGGCAPCNNSEVGTGSGPQAGSVDWTIPLGEALDGKSHGIFLLRSERVTASLASPDALVYHPGEATTELVKVTGNSRRQARTPVALANISAVSGGYHVSFYRSAQVGAKDTDGFYTVTGDPYLVWQVAYADAAGVKTLTLTRQYQGQSITHTFSDETTAEGHILTAAQAGGLRRVIKTTRIDPEDSTREIVRTVVKDAEGEIATETEEVFRVHSWARLRLSEALDPDGANLVTRWEYDEEEESPNRGTLWSVATPDGLTKYYSHDYYGRATTATYSSAGWVSRSIAAYTGYYQDRVFVEGTVTPTRASRRYRIISPDDLVIDGVAYRQEEVQVPLYYGEDYIWDSSVYLDFESFDNPSNLFTFERYIKNGPFANRIAWRLEADGQLTIWNYSADPATGVETTVVFHGLPNTEKTSVTHGTRQETRRDRAGITIYSQTSDIASGNILSQEEVEDRDDSGRPTLLSYLDGSTESRTYSPCCGLLETITRNGHTITYGYDLLGRKIREEENGIVTHFDLDAEGRVKRERRVGTDETEIITHSWEYDKAGRLITQKDGRNRPTGYEVEYLSDGKRKEITTKPGGPIVNEVFNADGTLDGRYGDGAESNPWWTYALEETEDGSVTAITEYQTETEWVKTLQDMQGRRLKVVYPDGAEETFTYDVSGRPLSQIDADGVITLWRYERGDLGGGIQGERTTQVVDLGADGTAGNGEINLAGTDRVTRTTNTFATRAEGSQTVPVRRMQTEVWFTDGEDTPRETSVADSSLDGLSTWHTARGLTTKSVIEYDEANATRTETTTYPDKTSVVRLYLHERLQSEVRRDSLGQPVTSLSQGYDAHGRPNVATDALGRVTTTVYYNDDQIHTVTSPDPDTSRVGEGYDPQVTTYTHDDAGRVWKVEQPDGSITETTYWGSGKVKRVSGGRVYPQAYTYDDAGRLSTLTTWQDYAGESGEAVTTWNYHPERGWLESKMDSEWYMQSYTYTNAGRLETKSSARWLEDELPIVTTYGYDKAGMLNSITYSDGTPAVAHTYDRAGRLHTTTDAAGLLTRSYDPVSLRVSGEVYTGAGHLSGRSIARTYDSLQRAQALSTDGGYGLAYGYDKAGRLETVNQGFHSATFSYQAGTSLRDRTVIKRIGVERVRHQRDLDRIGRTNTVSSVVSGASAVARGYTYNDANQRMGVSLENGRSWVFDYDDLGQVKLAKKLQGTDPVSSPTLPGYSFGYTFDDIGNRVQTVTNGHDAVYRPDVLNRYIDRIVPGVIDVRGEAHADATVTVDTLATTRTPIGLTSRSDFYRELTTANDSASVSQDIEIEASRVSPPESASETRAAFLPQTPEAFVHDEDGNLKQDGRWDYTWDAENRLIKMVTRASVATAFPNLKKRLTFAYDAQGRRIRKTVENWDSGTSDWVVALDLLFVYDGWNLLTELAANNANAVVRSHAWGLDLSGSTQGAGGVGGLLWTSTPTHSFAASHDANGNIVAWINTATLAVAGRADYGAFGEVVQATGVARELPFGFSTKYTDAETGFAYYGFRYYNPGTGRWLSRDPIGERGGVNLYHAMFNSPLFYIDPLGLSCSISLYVGHGGMEGDTSEQKTIVDTWKKRFDSNERSYQERKSVYEKNGGAKQTIGRTPPTNQNDYTGYGLIGCQPNVSNGEIGSNFGQAYRIFPDDFFIDNLIKEGDPLISDPNVRAKVNDARLNQGTMEALLRQGLARAQAVADGWIENGSCCEVKINIFYSTSSNGPLFFDPTTNNVRPRSIDGMLRPEFGTEYRKIKGGQWKKLR